MPLMNAASVSKQELILVHEEILIIKSLVLLSFFASIPMTLNNSSKD